MPSRSIPNYVKPKREICPAIWLTVAANQSWGFYLEIGRCNACYYADWQKEVSATLTRNGAPAFPGFVDWNAAKNALNKVSRMSHASGSEDSVLVGPFASQQAVGTAIGRLPQILENTLRSLGESAALQPGVIGGYRLGSFDVHVYPIIKDLAVGRDQGSTKNKESDRAATTTLTVSNVQAAVDRVVDWTRKGGGVAVTGIQEDPGRNEARADLQFNGFLYNANGFANIPKPTNEVTPPPPDTNSPTFYEDMASIPARERHVATYSGPGVATLKHYSDGRWVLTQVEFNFNQLNSTVNIQ